MNLRKKKQLASRALGIGLHRIAFNHNRISDIKEAITKQDMKDLHADNAISIKEISGRKTHEKRRTRRRDGSIKKRVNKSKRTYVILTRKLRAYIMILKKKGEISNELYTTLRKEIRASLFRSKNHLKERILSHQNEKNI